MTNYSIDDGNGNRITTGLAEHEAHTVAQRLANERAQTLYVYESDDVGSPDPVRPAAVIVATSDLYPTKHDVEDGLDRDISIIVGSQTFQGGVTLVPDTINGGLQAYGDTLHTWVSNGLLKALDRFDGVARKELIRVLLGVGRAKRADDTRVEVAM